MMRLNVFFKGLQPENVLTMFLFFMKHSYLLTAKITSDLINLSFTWCERAFVGYTLHVCHNFWYLFMASTKSI